MKKLFLAASVVALIAAGGGYVWMEYFKGPKPGFTFDETNAASMKAFEGFQHWEEARALGDTMELDIGTLRARHELLKQADYAFSVLGEAYKSDPLTVAYLTDTAGLPFTRQEFAAELAEAGARLDFLVAEREATEKANTLFTELSLTLDEAAKVPLDSKERYIALMKAKWQYADLTTIPQGTALVEKLPEGNPIRAIDGMKDAAGKAYVATHCGEMTVDECVLRTGYERAIDAAGPRDDLRFRFAGIAYQEGVTGFYQELDAGLRNSEGSRNVAATLKSLLRRGDIVALEIFLQQNAGEIDGIRPVSGRFQAFSGRQFHGMSSSMRLIL